MTDPTTVGPTTEDIGSLENDDAGWRIVQHEHVRVVSYDLEGERAHSLQVLGTDGEWHEVQWSASAESVCGHLGALGGHADQLRQQVCPEDHADIGVRLRQARRSRDLSQPQAAEQLGVAVDTVRSWESGRRSPSGLYRRQLLDWLDS